MSDSGEIRRLILADGTVLDKSECGYADGRLWCFLKNISIDEAFQIFSDPEKTRTIIFEYGMGPEIAKTEYNGYISIVTIVKRELTVDVCLMRGDEGF